MVATGRRQSIRLKGFDYSEPGSYFVTVCVKDRECLLGDVVNGKIELNDVGRIVSSVWHDLAKRFKNIELDGFVIMPNHVHGIVVIVGAPLAGARDLRAGTRPAPTLGDIIGAFKSVTARQYYLDSKGEKLWQRNYYERVIRNEKELFEIRRYIQENPSKWELDPENPERAA